MKTNLLILIINVLTISCFGQTRSKIIPLKDMEHEIYYYEGSYPVNEHQILSIFLYPEVISLHLYDEQFNEIGTKNIDRNTKDDNLIDFHLSKKYLLIEDEIKDKRFVTKVTLDGDFAIEKLGEEINIGHYNVFHVSASENSFYYPVSEGTTYLRKTNFETNTITNFKVELSAGESVGVHNIKSFSENENVVVGRTRYLKKNRNYQVALHDETGKEIAAFDRYVNNVFKSTAFYTNNNDEVYVTGNYKEMPKKDEINIYPDKYKKPAYTGIYLKSLNAKNPIDKYYKYADFKNFNKLMIADKNINKLSKFRFHLEDMAFVEDEKIIFATIEQDSYRRNREGSKEWDGREINYILIFAVNKEGEIIWDQAITLDWKGHPRPAQDVDCELNEFPKTLNIEKTDNTIKCHYSFKEKITSFEIKEGQIVNKKETLYVLKPDNLNKLVEYQYKHSVYWYDNLYFNYDKSKESYELEAIEF